MKQLLEIFDLLKFYCWVLFAASLLLLGVKGELAFPSSRFFIILISATEADRGSEAATRRQGPRVPVEGKFCWLSFFYGEVLEPISRIFRVV